MLCLRLLSHPISISHSNSILLFQYTNMRLILIAFFALVYKEHAFIHIHSFTCHNNIAIASSKPLYNINAITQLQMAPTDRHRYLHHHRRLASHPSFQDNHSLTTFTSLYWEYSSTVMDRMYCQRKHCI